MEIQYNGVPSALQPIIEERFESCAEYFPNWCQTVVVEYSANPQPPYELECTSEYKYRFIVITVSDDFFRQEKWREAILHEILHAVAAPFTTQIWAAAEILMEDSTIRKYIETQLREAEEAYATDLSRLMDKILQNSVIIY